jgi:flagellar biosynthesis/type III secretory pathway chaperone
MAITLADTRTEAETEDHAPAERKIRDLAVIAEKLIDVLSRENSALKAGATEDMNLLVDEKTALARILETRVQGLTADGVGLDGVDEDLRATAREAMDRVNAMINENGQRLRTAIAANKRVVELVQTAVKDARPGPSVYSAKGRHGYAQRPAQQARGMALSLDSVL